VALLPEPTIGRELAAGTLVAVRLATVKPLPGRSETQGAGSELVRPLGIIRSRGKPLSHTVERFIALLRENAVDAGASRAVRRTGATAGSAAAAAPTKGAAAPAKAAEKAPA
jgi:hypothetical protein